MSSPKPDALASLPPGRLVHLDVRDAIRRGEEPFDTIMTTVRGLGPDEVLVLRAPFEPLPLYNVLGRRGFVHWAESRADDDWSVYFWRKDSPSGRAPSPPPVAMVDVRGLEPPHPMVRILELLDTLAPGQRLVVTHERRPMLLYPLLEEQGCRHETEELGPSEVRITIWREGPGA